jgi:2-(1,2-epoxy-1,2-dihydrophenyl)acetyl-CoA isomerase
MSESSPLLVSIEHGIATLTMNQPHKLNALSAEMSSLGKQYLSDFVTNPDVRVVILTGAGRAFCAGGDVGNMAANKAPKTFEEKLDGLRGAQEFAWQLHSLPMPTIAAVNGFAVGAGLGIALSCDIRIASDKAKFGTAYARVGLGGDFGTTWQLTQLVGPAKAKEMFFLADNVDADEAHRLGLANQVVEHDQLMDSALEMAARIAAGAGVSFRYMKENVNLAVHSDFRTILEREALTHMRCSQTDDHREGAQAFVEKRKPNFQGR